MRANELMINDLIYDTINRRYGKVFTISLAKPLPIGYYFGVNSECYILERIAKPIPITPEILEANGFIKTGYMCRCAHNLADFDNHAQLDYNLKFSTFEIKRMKNRGWTAKLYIVAQYVHELQHALRLAGLSDLADNFKVEEGGDR